MKWLLFLLLVPAVLEANNREKYNFNPQWLLHVGDIQGAERNSFSDKNWKKVTLPHAFNEDEAFKVGIENMIAVRTDNDWNYKERATGSRYQWNDKNFNVNYGGIPKNVWLHITDKLYQTLPLYSNLQTTGVYIYATDIRTKSREAIINAESEIRNEYDAPLSVNCEISVYDYDDKLVSTFRGEPMIVNPKTTAIVEASQKLDNLQFTRSGRMERRNSTGC